MQPQAFKKANQRIAALRKDAGQKTRCWGCWQCWHQKSRHFAKFVCWSWLRNHRKHLHGLRTQKYLINKETSGNALRPGCYIATAACQQIRRRNEASVGNFVARAKTSIVIVGAIATKAINTERRNKKRVSRIGVLIWRRLGMDAELKQAESKTNKQAN